MRLTRLIVVACALSAPGAAVAQTAADGLDARIQQVCGADNTEGQPTSDAAPRVSTHRGAVILTITAN